jgi:hypothetical protein
MSRTQMPRPQMPRAEILEAWQEKIAYPKAKALPAKTGSALIFIRRL